MNDEYSWFWTVKPTGTRSETPEIWGAELVANEDLARVAAEAAMRKADEAYGHPFRDA